MIEINNIIKIASKAGEAIMDIYKSSNKKTFKIEYKEDNSPLTIADKASNQIIIRWFAPIDVWPISMIGDNHYN